MLIYIYIYIYIYISTQSVPRCKLTRLRLDKTNWLIMYKTKVGLAVVQCHNYVEFLNVKPGVK